MGALTRAAVLVPLQVEASGERRLVLIQRTAGSNAHQGQVAFPGGRYDPDRDESLLATALREAEEEIALAPRDVTVLGALAEHRTLSTSYLISPFVGRIPLVYTFRPDPREVESVFTAPLHFFEQPERREALHVEFGGTSFVVPSVRVDAYVVWGVTLRIIDDLVASGFSRR